MPFLIVCIYKKDINPSHKTLTFSKNKPSGFSKASDIKPFIPKPEELIAANTQSQFQKDLTSYTSVKIF